jgi:hypothetical protein
MWDELPAAHLGSSIPRGGVAVDSDLAESIAALKESFVDRGRPADFRKGDFQLVDAAKERLALTRRYRDFVLDADPVDVETVTPGERVRLVPSSELDHEQVGFCTTEAGVLRTEAGPGGWRPSWVIIGHNALGDPFFLETNEPDAEGDCPVYTAMSGTDTWQPRLCATSFELFLRILAITMKVAKGFAEDTFDVDDEHVFREALGPRLREYDRAALKAGHWT